MKQQQLGREGYFNDTKPCINEEVFKTLPNNLVNKEDK